MVQDRRGDNNGQTESRGKMTVEEAGRRGGESTSAAHGSEFYRDIGRQGGKKSGRRGRDEAEERSGEGEERSEEEMASQNNEEETTPQP